MWEAIANMINGGNGVYILVFILTVLIIVMILTKFGGLSIHTSSFSMGVASKEREIIRRQIEAAHSFVLEAIDMFEVDGDDYHVKYIFERIYDKIVEWIMFNHISTNQIYIDSKSMAVYNLIMSLNPPNFLKKQDVKKDVNEWVKKVVQQLLQIREYYSIQGR